MSPYFTMTKCNKLFITYLTRSTERLPTLPNLCHPSGQTEQGTHYTRNSLIYSLERAVVDPYSINSMRSPTANVCKVSRSLKYDPNFCPQTYMISSSAVSFSLLCSKDDELNVLVQNHSWITLLRASSLESKFGRLASNKMYVGGVFH